jgi:hypothetical protein
MSAMRAALASVVVVAACNGGGPCDHTGPAEPMRCAAGGLAGMNLDGTWTMTGTIQRAGAQTPVAYTEPLAFTVEEPGTGWCKLSLAGGDAGLTWVDDTFAAYANDVGSSTHTWEVCVSPNDGTLTYEQYDNPNSGDLSTGTSIMGVLTR